MHGQVYIHTVYAIKPVAHPAAQILSVENADIVEQRQSVMETEVSAARHKIQMGGLTYSAKVHVLITHVPMVIVVVIAVKLDLVVRTTARTHGGL